MAKTIYLVAVTIGTQKNYVCDVISMHPSGNFIVSYTTRQEEAHRFDSFFMANLFTKTIHNPHYRNFEAVAEKEEKPPEKTPLILKEQKLK